MKLNEFCKENEDRIYDDICVPCGLEMHFEKNGDVCFKMDSETVCVYLEDFDYKNLNLYKLTLMITDAFRDLSAAVDDCVAELENVDINDDWDDDGDYNADHAKEWSERHPHGYYNDESDYGTDSDAFDE